MSRSPASDATTAIAGSPSRQQAHWSLLAVLLMAPFLAQADATIANVATPAIRTGLHTSGAAAQWVIGGYFVAYAVLLITGARLGQTHGYKRLFVLGVVVFGGASLVAGLAPDAEVLIFARVIQGAGAAAMYPQALTGIQINFTGVGRTKAIGSFAIALAAGAVMGQILGGVLVSTDISGASWRPIFIVNVPICIAVVFGARRYLPADSERHSDQLDLRGVAALTPGLLLLVLPLTLGREEGWPIWIWIALVARLPAIAMFFATQRRATAAGRHPLIDTSVLGQTPVAFGLAALLVATGTYYALLFTLAQYLQTGLGKSALVSGLVLVPWVIMFGSAGRLLRYLPSHRTPMLPTVGCLLLSAAYLSIAADTFAGQQLGVVFVLLLGVGGFGLGINFAALIGHLTNIVPTGYAPDISGVITTTLQVGGAIGVAGLGSLYFALAPHRGSTPSTHAFAATSLALGAAGLIATFFAYLSTHSGVNSRDDRERLLSTRTGA